MGDPDTQRKQAASGLEQLATLVRAQAWHEAEAPTLSPTQRGILRALDGQPGGLRAGRIAERLGVSAASLSESLKTLEARAWISREADPDDGRAWRLKLSRSGKRISEKLQDSSGMASLIAGLDDHDIGALLRIVQLLVRQAQTQGLATGMRTCLGCRYFRPYASGRSDQPHVCALVDQAFGDVELRADCPEQEPADPVVLQTNATRFQSTHLL